MASFKYIGVGILIIIIGLVLHYPYNLIFGASSYLDNYYTFILEFGLIFFGGVTIFAGIFKERNYRKRRNVY